MCGRFVIHAKKEDIVERFDIDEVQLPVFEPKDNIPPGTDIPFIYQTENKRKLSSAYWGLIPSWAKDKSFASHTFNARSETIAEKPSFREAYKQRRCLIPASAYYEWAKVRINGKVAGKQPFQINREDKELFAFAGIYENWTDNSTGEMIQSCTVITREAYSKIHHIHPRMPIILPKDHYQAWLDSEIEDFPMITEDKLNFFPLKDGLGSKSNNYEFIF